MMEQEEVVYLKVFDSDEVDVVFEGKVSTDVEPDELVKLSCFWDRALSGVFDKATGKKLKSFKGLQNNVELVARGDGNRTFSGVLYVRADDGVLRTSESVPLCECVMMSVSDLSQEESEKVFKCETLEELEMYYCDVKLIPRDIGKMKKLKNLRIFGLDDLMSIPEEMGELSSLEELRIEECGVESLPKRLKELKMLKSISFWGLKNLQLNAEDLVVFSKLKHLAVRNCGKVFTPRFKQAFWEMIKSTVDIRVLDLYLNEHDGAMVVAALEENGSIVDERKLPVLSTQRNKENHKRARECVVCLLAIRRWRNALNGVPKEMVKMIAMMLWMMRCDVKAWRKDVR